LIHFLRKKEPGGNTSGIQIKQAPALERLVAVFFMTIESSQSELSIVFFYQKDTFTLSHDKVFPIEEKRVSFLITERITLNLHYIF